MSNTSTVNQNGLSLQDKDIQYTIVCKQNNSHVQVGPICIAELY